jgi:ABC-type multidrug transport system ATPase subunit
MNTILQVTQLTKKYKKFAAIDEVSFAVEKG